MSDTINASRQRKDAAREIKQQKSSKRNQATEIKQEKSGKVSQTRAVRMDSLKGQSDNTDEKTVRKSQPDKTAQKCSVAKGRKML